MPEMRRICEKGEERPLITRGRSFLSPWLAFLPADFDYHTTGKHDPSGLISLKHDWICRMLELPICLAPELSFLGVLASSENSDRGVLGEIVLEVEDGPCFVSSGRSEERIFRTVKSSFRI